MGRYYNDGWGEYVSVATRRQRAAKLVEKMRKRGKSVSPIEIEGRKIAVTFWGNAWCKNLEAYSDYANRLPRGRTYVRNGSVVDLQIEKERVTALVSGSRMYKVDIAIKPLAKKRWSSIKSECGGKIDSLVELLQGSLSKGVMEVVTRKGEGLFPAPREISLSCSCPDWATMCKHVAATLYGVGARLDHEPELLFVLRGVDPAEMMEAAIKRPPTGAGFQRGRVLEAADLSSVFGVDIELDETSADDVPTRPKRPAKRAKAAKRPAAKKAAKKAAVQKAATAGKAPKKAAAKKAPKKGVAKKAPKKAAAKPGARRKPRPRPSPE